MLAAQARKKGTGKAGRDPGRTRASLLRAAFGEMHRSGFRGSDLETILHQAGVTKGAMYHHFDNKEAMGYAVVDEVIGKIMRAKWQAPLQEARNPIDALIGIVRSTSLKPALLTRGCPLNNLAQEMSPLDEGFRRRTARLFDDWRGAVATALRQGQKRGTVRKDVNPDETATFLIAAYEGYMSLAKCFQDAGGLRAGQKTIVRYLESLRP
jgi:TetR/AcrR family transcriptional regulator, transcriptional repressor for nem operon